ncbi:MAG: glycosyltransferase [Geminocystis sp.]|nr:glycosyltransferase [Geminocystis sp.]MCS7147982.1 glycosyltransferase [Geminocystis sp.]MDW8116938.1 glycosyltransferase [Geminocystis sp.]MDW8462528.1 glycosyltransferase [Geminocystis sp.]
MKKENKIALIGTYPPRACGIATFTADLRQALRKNNQKSMVIAITNEADSLDYPEEVVFEIKQNRIDDYRLAAEYINFSGVDLVCVQHEFGIFGGNYGRYVTELLLNLQKPVVTTLHTVLQEPTPALRETLLRIADASEYLVVLSKKAIAILKEVYGIPEGKIAMIHHGVPDTAFIDPNFYKDKFKVEGRFVILTFGLISRNKGIEFMLEALPPVVKAHPEVVYIILGATHPEVKRREGEEYRVWLKRRVRELNLENNVLFFDRYVDFEQLCEFIGAADIYVTPYRSKEQIVSGTLAYAIGMGKAIVSTPYFYAEEMLADGRGRLVNFQDVEALSNTLLELIEDEAGRHRMRKLAYQFGRQMVWQNVGKSYALLFDKIISGQKKTIALLQTRGKTVFVGEMAEARLEHIIHLTDDTGIFQHAIYSVPDRRHGYCTDDVARALVAVLNYYQQYKEPRALDLARCYLSFIHYAQMPDGRFHNFMNYSRQFIDQCGSEDTIGRALWGLGVTVSTSPDDKMQMLAKNIFERTIETLSLQYPRAMAYAICGLSSFLERYEGAVAVRRLLTEMAEQLASLYHSSCSEDWLWFGDELTYANAKLPQAMLLAYQVTGEQSYKKIGLQSLDFLLEQTYRNGYFDFIGNQGWYIRGQQRAIFGQQPIEAGYTIETCCLAYEITGNPFYLDMARAAVEWFLGRNRLGVRLYDFTTGACCDGIDPQGVNMNQGAESTICCLLGLLAASRQRERQTDSTPTPTTTATTSVAS